MIVKPLHITFNNFFFINEENFRDVLEIEQLYPPKRKKEKRNRVIGGRCGKIRIAK